MAGLADLVDLVDVNNTPLRRVQIEIGGVEQLEQKVLHVLADIARFGQRRGVTNREGHIQALSQGLGQKGLA